MLFSPKSFSLPEKKRLPARTDNPRERSRIPNHRSESRSHSDPGNLFFQPTGPAIGTVQASLHLAGTSVLNGRALLINTRRSGCKEGIWQGAEKTGSRLRVVDE